MLEKYDFSKIEDSKKSKFIFIVAVVVILIAIGVVSWLLAQNPKNKPLPQTSTNRTFCQQDSDCVLIPAYENCCSVCGQEAVPIKGKESIINQRQKLCPYIDQLCPVYKCPLLQYQAVCEQNKCVAKVTPIVANTGLIVSLDKINYYMGEIVNITLQNNGAAHHSVESIDIEYYAADQNKWQVADNDIFCPCNAKCEKAAVIIIEFNESKNFIWNQETNQIIITDNPIGAKVPAIETCQKAKPGKYRVSVLHSANWSAETVVKGITNSNEFTISEKLSNLNIGALSTSGYKIISSYTSPGEASFIEKIGNNVFMTDISEGLLAIDVSNPAQPKLLSKIKIDGSGSYALAVDLNDPYLFVSGYGNAKVALVNIKDPAIMNVISEIDARRSVQDMVLVGDYAYLAIDGPEVEIFNVEREKLSPYAARGLTSKSIINISGGHAIGIAVEYFPELTLLSIAQGENGIGIYAMNYPTDSPTLQTNISDIGYVSTVAISGNYVYAGVGNKVKIIDLSAKKEVGSIDANEVWGLKVKDNMLYVASGEEGVKIFDVSDVAKSKQIAVIDTPGRARDLVVDGDYIYVADDRNDLQIIGK